MKPTRLHVLWRSAPELPRIINISDAHGRRQQRVTEENGIQDGKCTSGQQGEEKKGGQRSYRAFKGEEDNIFFFQAFLSPSPALYSSRVEGTMIVIWIFLSECLVFYIYIYLV